MSETVERTELLPGSALALGSLLDVPDLDNDAGLPLLWHWIYLLDRPAHADLGLDDHPLRGTTPAPAGPGRRRMWAGGRVRTGGLLRCGESATRRSMVESVQEKQGRSGLLTFMVVRHLIVQRGTLVVDEQQDIVYRDAASPAEQASPITAGPVIPPGDGERAIKVSPTLLFRFSALTYNSHRIHHDRDYARDVEGYHGLLTHAPLQALAMAEAARAAEARTRVSCCRLPAGHRCSTTREWWWTPYGTRTRSSPPSETAMGDAQPPAASATTSEGHACPT
jgi:3-methylfumaryl-CoA hydratase